MVKAGPDFVELDATVAFPEGGKQESDRGDIALDDGTVLRLIASRRFY
ncbi:MAG: hypothetical protein M3Y65_24660 [Pseudomonadota bacterium]|nr:hypothetical protein [Pseudomonadota bacterium]